MAAHKILVSLGQVVVFDDVTKPGPGSFQRRPGLCKCRGSRAAPQYTHRLFGQISGVDNRLIILTFHIGHGQVGNSPREAQLLEVDLRHRNGSGRNIVLAGGNASENFTQRSCLVPDLKSARRAQTQQQLVVESDDSTARPVLEWGKSSCVATTM